MSTKKVVFRVDASLQIGTGHAMRCLTLADTLRDQGFECYFICRKHPGNLIEQIRSRGYCVQALVRMMRPESISAPSAGLQLKHHLWLGSTQEQDVTECVPFISDLRPDWLIVDHYALDVCWENALQPHCRNLMVIDDLADRVHECDLLLDQNLGHTPQDYAGLVPQDCQLLIGPQFALLRPEFAKLREYSLKRRINSQLKHILITMGGVDQSNATGQILEALRACHLPADCRITVVMGVTAPWLKQVCGLAERMPWSVDVVSNITDMAQRLADCDLAIGAAGSTSWERCCLGVPCVVVCLAENQQQVINELEKAKAALVLDIQQLKHNVKDVMWQKLNSLWAELPAFSAAAAQVTSGLGSQYVACRIRDWT